MPRNRHLSSILSSKHIQILFLSPSNYPLHDPEIGARERSPLPIAPHRNGRHKLIGHVVGVRSLGDIITRQHHDVATAPLVGHNLHD